MSWDVDPKAAKRLNDIADAMKGADRLILATDPDREGEAISWHVLEVLQKKRAVKGAEVQRVVFNAITKSAVTEAMRNPRQIDMELVDAYLARRALDYWWASPCRRCCGASCRARGRPGRCNRWRCGSWSTARWEIEAFKTQEYWSVEADVSAGADPFLARLVKLDRRMLKKVRPGRCGHHQCGAQLVAEGSFTVTSVEKKPARRSPAPPFTTSTLQQEAARKLGFSAQRTMQAAQKLYEGVDEAGGLITYMRTDGVQSSQKRSPRPAR